METFSFELKLIDSVTAAAKKAKASVESIADSSKKTQRIVDDGWTKIAAGLETKSKRAQASAQRMGKAHAAALNMNAKLEAASAKLKEKNAAAAERAAARVVAAERKMTLAHMAALKEDKQRTYANGMTSAEDTKKGGMFDWAVPFGGGRVMSQVAGDLIYSSIVSAAHLAADLFKTSIAEAFKAASEEETSRIGERNILGVEGGKAFRQDVERFDKMTPFDDGEIRKMMLDLRKAGIGQAASRQMFATATDLGGGDSGAVSGLLGDFRTIYTQRGVTRKQLKSILGDVGQTIPDFYAELGKRMKTSAKDAEKKATAGGIDPQLIMNMITEAQNKRQGGEAGTGGQRFADSLAGQWKKVLNLPDEFFKRFVDSPLYGQATASLHNLLEGLDPESPNGQRLMASLEGMFEKIVTWVSDTFTPENIDAFADGINNAIDFGENLWGVLKGIGGVLGDAWSILDSLGVGTILKGTIETVAMLVSQVRQLFDWLDELEGKEQRLQAHAPPGSAHMPLDFESGMDVANSLRPSTALVASAGNRSSSKVTNINSPLHVNVNGHANPDQVKQAVVDAHRQIVTAHERAAAEGG